MTDLTPTGARTALASGNTNKLGTGTEYRLLVDANGKLVVSATIIGATGAFNPETDDDSIPAGEERETPNSLIYAYDGVSSNSWERLQTDGSGRLYVSDGGGSITVDGTFWQATQPISAAALPLPAGASTSAIQTTMNTSLDEIESAIENLEEALNSIGTDYLRIGDAGSLINLDPAGDVQVDILTSALPTGAATSALQTTGNSALAEIESAIENLEEALQSIGTDYLLIGDAGSIINLDAGGDVQVDVKTMPVVAVTGTFWQATQPVSLASIPAFNAETDDDDIPLAESRETVIALLYGKDTGGNWERVLTNGSGALKVYTP